jgi:hypothetical protein
MVSRIILEENSLENERKIPRFWGLRVPEVRDGSRLEIRRFGHESRDYGAPRTKAGMSRGESSAREEAVHPDPEVGKPGRSRTQLITEVQRIKDPF